MFSVLWHKAILSLGLGIGIGLLDSFGMSLSTKWAIKQGGKIAQIVMIFSSSLRLLILGCIIFIIFKHSSLSIGWFIAGLLPITIGKLVIAAGALKKS